LARRDNHVVIADNVEWGRSAYLPQPEDHARRYGRRAGKCFWFHSLKDMMVI
jgi:hypothetical protein